jgi:hypothetical protein
MSETQLTADCSPTADGWQCRVTVGDDAGQSNHEVSVARADLERYAAGSDDPALLVRASFRFLLEREPREAILRRFELPVIERYFPEYPSAIGRYLDEE